MSEYYGLGDQIRFGITIHHPSGTTSPLVNADETPRWFVYTSTSGDNPLMQGNFGRRANLIGTYSGEFMATSANNFVTNDWVEVHASGKVNGVVGRSIIRSFRLDDLYKVNVIQMSGVPVDPITDSFYANIKFVKDSNTPRDEYTVNWFRNANPLPSGAVTNAYLSVYKTSDSTALFADQKIDYGSIRHGTLRYNDEVNLAVSGEPYLAIASGTIAGAVRVWPNLVGLDYL